MIHEGRQKKNAKKNGILNLYLTFFDPWIFVSSRRWNGTQPLIVHNNGAIEFLATEHRSNPRKKIIKY